MARRSASHPTRRSRSSARTRPAPPVTELHHRDIRGGAARAAVFGVSDGLVSNVALILGVAGADATTQVVRVAGLAGLLAGAFSMAAGEWVSMRAQAELLEHELEMERIELRRNPHVEEVELAQIYQSRGVDPDTSRAMASEMMRDPDVALQAHAREELGIDPESLGSPVAAAVASFLAFGVGALVPLLPWFFGGGDAATIASVIAGAVGAVVVGAVLARFTRRPAMWSAGRQLAIAAVAAGVTYLVGSLVGVGVP